VKKCINKLLKNAIPNPKYKFQSKKKDLKTKKNKNT
jgi:hypothetical protein